VWGAPIRLSARGVSVEGTLISSIVGRVDSGVEAVDHRVGKLTRAEGTAEVAGPLSRGDTRVVGVANAHRPRSCRWVVAGFGQVVEHHDRAHDHGERVGDVLSGDIRRGPMHRLEDVGIVTEVGSGRHAESGAWSLTSYRMSAEEWTEAEAKAFCRAHDGILFEPATGESMSDDPAGAAADTVELTASATASQRLRLARLRLELKSNR